MPPPEPVDAIALREGANLARARRDNRIVAYYEFVMSSELDAYRRQAIDAAEARIASLRTGDAVERLELFQRLSYRDVPSSEYRGSPDDIATLEPEVHAIIRAGSSNYWYVFKVEALWPYRFVPRSEVVAASRPPAPVVVREEPARPRSQLEIPESAYPRRALERNRGGKVVLALSISAEGRVESVELKSESPSGYGFARVAQKHAWDLSFYPATRNGVPVAGTYQQEFTFRVTERGGN